jgi:transcriptional regulator with XRE-family HTH domain
MTNTNTFTRFIRRRRQSLNKTQAEIARACGLTGISITLVEGGHRRLGLERVPRLAAALDVDAAELCRMALATQLPMLAAALAGGAAVTAAETN